MNKLNATHIIMEMRHILVFFSCRRRHTRWPRDWSSDVCSSDLIWHGSGNITANGRLEAMTLEQVRSKTERIREFAALPFLLMAVVSVLGVVVRPAAQPIKIGRASCRERVSSF